jgi:hypothetical protein
MIVVQLFSSFDRNESYEIGREIEESNTSMDHCSFRFVFPTTLKKLRIAKLYARSDSLEDILWVHPFWCTRKANAKAIVIARIVIGIKFLHSFGFIHSHQKLGNAFSSEYHRI